MVIVALADAHELQRRFHHPLRRVPETVHDAVRQRAVVCADAHGNAVVPELQNQRLEALLDALQLSLIFPIAILALGEPFLVGVVAGVDAHLLHVLRSLESGVGGEVDVGNQRYAHAAAIQRCLDVPQILGLVERRRRQPHQLATGVDQLDGFGHRGVGVHGVADGHRLQADRVVAADGHVANVDDARFAAVVGKGIPAVGGQGDHRRVLLLIHPLRH